MIYSIAVDGPSGAGKSTVAKAVAKKLSISYVDTGAIYRTIGLFAYRCGVAAEDSDGVSALLPKANIDIVFQDGVQHMYLNGEDVTESIREHIISHYASAVSAIPDVRSFLLDLQRRFAKTQSVIMDGRDIGTVVLPNADVKIFLTAKLEIRAQRRYIELREKGNEITYEKVLDDMRERDYRDSHRASAPLKQADDALLIDTSELGLEQAINAVVAAVSERIPTDANV